MSFAGKLSGPTRHFSPTLPSST